MLATTVYAQEEALAEARQVEGEAATYLDALTRYFVHRAKLCGKLAKYPHLDDYRRAIRELDEKEFITLRLVCAELRNHYVSCLLSMWLYIHYCYCGGCGKF